VAGHVPAIFVNGQKNAAPHRRTTIVLQRPTLRLEGKWFILLFKSELSWVAEKTPSNFNSLE
jgi:hypothetical protein